MLALVTTLVAAQTGCLMLPAPDGATVTVPLDGSAASAEGGKILHVRHDEAKSGPARKDEPELKTLPEPRKDESEAKKEKEPATLPAPKGDPASALPSTRVAGGFTFDQVVNATLLSDPKIRAGLEAIPQANGDLINASLPPNPVLTIYQSLLPLTRPFTPDKTGGPPQLDVGIGYGIDWFLFGKRAAAMASAAVGVQVSEADFADLIRQRVRDASQEYFNVLEAQALLELARIDLQTKEQTEEITRRARAAGGRTEIDLDRIRLETLLSQQAVRDAQAAAASAKARLRALMGRRDFDPNFGVTGDLKDLPAAEAPSVEEAFVLAEANRPDIRSLHAKVAQADANVTVEDRNACPQVTARAGYTRQFQTQAIGQPDANSYGFGLDVSLPICNRNQGNRLKARSVAAQRRHELEGGLVDLRSEVAQAVIEYRTALLTSRSYASEQIDLARTVRDRVTSSFRLGSGTLLIVLDAQRIFRDTYRASISSRAAAWRAFYRLRSATGSQVFTHERAVDEPAHAGK